MKEIPELLLKCCNTIHKPQSIILFDDCVKITFYCSRCRNFVRLEIRNGMKKMLSDVDSIKKTKKSSYKYIKGVDVNGEKRN